MISFLFRALLRDTNRSLLPGLVIAVGVALSTFMAGYLEGVFTGFFGRMAALQTGHIMVMTRGYYQARAQLPNDLALTELDSVKKLLTVRFPQLQWVPRIRFAGLLDVPTPERETAQQMPVMGLGMELLDAASGEEERLQLDRALKVGTLPRSPEEILIGSKVAERLHLNPGGEVTFLGSDTSGELSVAALRVAGIVHFGVQSLDRNLIVLDITEAQTILGMDDAAGELLGYFKDGLFHAEEGEKIAGDIASLTLGNFPQSLIAVPMNRQEELMEYFTYLDQAKGIMLFLLLVVMVTVLWNAALISGLRRHREFGIRLALGESHRHLYATIIVEGVLLAAMATVVGAAVGLAGAYYLQVHGFDVSEYMRQAEVIFPEILRARITPGTVFWGAVPGFIAAALGSALAGRRIFKRETASLMRELSV